PAVHERNRVAQSRRRRKWCGGRRRETVISRGASGGSAGFLPPQLAPSIPHRRRISALSDLRRAQRSDQHYGNVAYSHVRTNQPVLNGSRSPPDKRTSNDGNSSFNRRANSATPGRSLAQCPSAIAQARWRKQRKASWWRNSPVMTASDIPQTTSSTSNGSE